MAAFVEAGGCKINLDAVAYVEKIQGGVKVHFVGPGLPLTLATNESEVLMAAIEALQAKVPWKDTERE